MNRYLTKFLFILSFSSASFATTDDLIAPEKTPKWIRLNTLIEKEISTIKGISNLGPRLEYRLLELDTERLKLIKEKENYYFLTAGPEKRKGRDKISFFSESRALTQSIEKRGLKLISSNSGFRQIPDIYYTLGLNDRDYLDAKKTERYLLMSKSGLHPKSPLSYNVHVALAEFYYNEKQYPKATKLYQTILENQSDQWYAKHLYNAAWCNLKVESYDLAIEQLKESFRVSLNTKYISFRDQSLDALTLFYVTAEKINDGIQFLESNELPERAELYIKLARRNSEKGKFQDTRQVILSALNDTRRYPKEQIHQKQVNLRLAELDIYRSNKQHQHYYETAQRIYELNNEKKLTDADREEAVNKIRELVGYLQIRLSKNMKVGVDEYSPDQLKIIINYFSILASLDIPKTDEYNFFQGETYFSVGVFDEAFKSYAKGLEFSKKATEQERQMAQARYQKANEGKDPKKVAAFKYEDTRIELKGKILNSLLASLEYGKFDQNKNYQYTVYTFKNHLDIFPVNEKSQQIYPKLFHLYMDKENTKPALAVLESYRINYAADRELQKTLFTRIVDLSIEKKNTDDLAFWVNKMREGYLGFDGDTIEKATIILGKILFDGYHKMASEGKKQDAIKGYTAIFNDERYPHKIKGEAAFSNAVHYLELADTKASSDWLKQSYNFLNRTELSQLLPNVVGIIGTYSLHQNFDLAIDHSRYIFRKYCREDFKDKDQFLKNHLQYTTMELGLNAAWEESKRFVNCFNDQTQEVEFRKNLLSLTVRKKQFRIFHQFYTEAMRSEAFHSLLGDLLITAYWESAPFTGQSRLEAWILGEIDKHGKQFGNSKAIAFGQHKNNYEQYLKKRSQLSLVSFTETKPFDPEIFMKELEINLLTIKKYEEFSDIILATKEADYILNFYHFNQKMIDDLVSKISGVVIQDMPEEFVKSFHEQMAPLTKDLQNRAGNYNKTAVNLINKNNLLIESSKSFSPGRMLFEKVSLRYPASLMTSSIDITSEAAGARK